VNGRGGESKCVRECVCLYVSEWERRREVVTATGEVGKGPGWGVCGGAEGRRRGVRSDGGEGGRGGAEGGEGEGEKGVGGGEP
jgi:hypothetical protein